MISYGCRSGAGEDTEIHKRGVRGGEMKKGEEGRDRRQAGRPDGRGKRVDKKGGWKHEYFRRQRVNLKLLLIWFFIKEMNTHTHLSESVEDFRCLSDQCSSSPPQQRCSLSGPLIDLLWTDARQDSPVSAAGQPVPGTCDRKHNVWNQSNFSFTYDGLLCHCNCDHIEKILKPIWHSTSRLCTVIWSYRRRHDAERHLAFRFLLQLKG